MPSFAHAMGLLAQAGTSWEAGHLSVAAQQLRLAADELDALAAMRPSRLALEDDHAGAAVNRAMRPTEHVSRPIGRVMAGLKGKGE